MEVTLVGLQNAGKTSVLRALGVSSLARPYCVSRFVATKHLLILGRRIYSRVSLLLH